MQIAQSGVQENIELMGRLKVEGRWYGKADVVALDERDAEVLVSRGLAVKAKKGSKPKNAPEKLHPHEIESNKGATSVESPNVVTKDTEATNVEAPVVVTKETGHAQRSGKKR